ncbi:hypothetical protein B0T22DRAFT_382286 [Podospora appendiculata]|uniref:HDA1 complex subunit n=1 Tax=Podospora appendiculata TaxID=314037 RepID=A0AAE1CAG4_9PEZI|nr:hypothetical protein B0T22DRAFT_388963 [Podospora appendiculata]KAK3685531.1 hypothetical protein B0T22DRAFT_382286 [Podospora appendiculata]
MTAKPTKTSSKSTRSRRKATQTSPRKPTSRNTLPAPKFQDKAPDDPGDVFYEIKSIIDEKYVKKKLFYKLDWADHPETGERYPPSWARIPPTLRCTALLIEPAENVTLFAIAAWEQQKREQQESPSPESESESQSQSQSQSRPAKRGHWSLEVEVGQEDDSPPSKKAKTTGSAVVDDDDDDDDGDDDVDVDWDTFDSFPKNQGTLIVKIPAHPNFEPSDYQPVSHSRPSSQAEGEPHLGASVPSPLRHQTEPQGRVSQTTIPDSQALSDSVPSQLLSAGLPVLAPQPAEAAVATQVLGEDRTSPSSPEAPSHQPDSPSEGSQLPTGLFEGPHSNTPRGGTSAGSSTNSQSSGFLTQPDYETAIPVFQSSSPRVRDFSPRQNDSDSHSHSHEFGRIGLSSHSAHHSSQFAQVVVPPSSNTGGIRTQTQQSFGNTENEDDVVPDTVLKQARGKADLQRSSQALCELDGNVPRPASDGLRSNGLQLGGRVFHPKTPRTLAHHLFKEFGAPLYGDMGDIPKVAADGTPLSLTQRLQLLQESVFNKPKETPSQPSPAPEAVQSHDLTLSQTLEQALKSPSTGFPGTATDVTPHPMFTNPGLPSGSGSWQDLTHDAELPTLDTTYGALEYEQIPATVAPSDLTASIDHRFLPTHASLPIEDRPVFGEDDDEEVGDADPDEREVEKQHDESQEFIVTLPMAANTRAQYLNTITENQETMYEFSNAFTTSHSATPDEKLVVKMDTVFEQLLDLCDLPTYAADLPLLTPAEMMKHATGTNSKFSFVYEFLNELKDVHCRVLIISRPGHVFQYLAAVLAAADFNHAILGQGDTAEFDPNELSVILAMADQDLTAIHGNIDVVVIFDHVAREVDLPATLGYDDMPPVVLTLIATYSLEHISLQLEESGYEVEGIERKNALNLTIASAKDLLRAPEEAPEPHQAAEIFANFLKSADNIPAEHQILPDRIFDIWLNSQESLGEPHLGGDLTSTLGSRKRPIDDVGAGTPKRARILDSTQHAGNSTPVQMSHLLRATLASVPTAGTGSEQLIEVPAPQLESMAAKIAELKARLNSKTRNESTLQELAKSLESQVRSYETSMKSIQPKYSEALGDRSAFEQESKKAVDEATAAKKRLEATKAELDTVKEQQKTLEAKLTAATIALANSGIPELTKYAETEQELKAAQDKIRSLEKKNASLLNETEYSRTAYQDASNANSELRAENQELSKKVAELQKLANANLLMIHRVNAEKERDATYRQVEDLTTIIADRERELERAREELRHLKNGRRETRQGSVPRSPRTGVMSPRPGRGMGGAGSRGTSPAAGFDAATASAAAAQVPGMTFFNQPAEKVRWGHLRD